MGKLFSRWAPGVSTIKDRPWSAPTLANPLRLRAVGLGHSYPGQASEHALREVNLAVEPGTIWGVLGPNGAGKSTLISLLDGTAEPNQGEVLLGDVPLGCWPRTETARRLATVPQRPSVPFPLTVGQLVMLGREPHRQSIWFDDQSDMDVTRWALETTGMDHMAGRLVASLSGGEAQRAWLAKALAQEPAFLLLDEPAAFLDPGQQVQFLDGVYRLARAQQVGTVMVLHDLSLAAQYCDHILLLQNGKPVAQGDPKTVLEKVLVERVFQVSIHCSLNEITQTPTFHPVGSVRRL